MYNVRVYACILLKARCVYKSRLIGKYVVLSRSIFLFVNAVGESIEDEEIIDILTNFSRSFRAEYNGQG